MCGVAAMFSTSGPVHAEQAAGSGGFEPGVSTRGLPPIGIKLPTPKAGCPAAGKAYCDAQKNIALAQLDSGNQNFGVVSPLPAKLAGEQAPEKESFQSWEGMPRAAAVVLAEENYVECMNKYACP